MSNESYKRWHKPNTSETSRTRQGYYKVINTNKYMGDPTLVIFRSSWEFSLCRWCDISPSVTRWSAEPTQIPYYDRISNLDENVKLGLDPNNPVNWKVRKYNVDFYIEITNGTDTEKWFVEVKPAHKLIKPKPIEPGSKLKDHKRFNEAAKEYLINEAKFAACKEFAERKGAKFFVFTENTLKKLGIL